MVDEGDRRVGLLKMDFLGLSTLTLITDAVAEIVKTNGERLDIDRIRSTMQDLQVFQDAHTYGVFQFESSGMRDILRRRSHKRSRT